MYLDVAKPQASEKSLSIRTQQRLVRVWPLNLPSVSVMLHPVLPTAELFVILIPFGVLLNFSVPREKMIFYFLRKMKQFYKQQGSRGLRTLNMQVPFPSQLLILISLSPFLGPTLEKKWRIKT